MSNRDLHLLNVFATVARRRGYAPAQAELNVSSSTISRQISDLEHRLGVKLCVRGRAGFGLTEEGKQVLAANKTLFDAMDEFSSFVDGIRGTPGGRLQVATTGSIVYHSSCRIAEALGGFRREAGQIEVVFHVTSPLELERGLIENHYEIGIGPFPERVHRALECRELFRERQLLYCSRLHPFFGHASEVSEDELAAADFAQRGYISLAQDPGKARFKIAATAFTDEAIAQLILSGGYIGYLPEHYAAHWIENDLIRSVRPDSFHYEVPYYVAYGKGDSLSSCASAFLQQLIDVHRRC